MTLRVDFENKVVLEFDKLTYTFEFLCTFEKLGITSSFTKDEIKERARSFSETRWSGGIR